MEDTRIQWHSGFVSAMDLELRQYRDSLIFEREYNLNTKPLEIDLLVIKKKPSTQISNEIGRFFRGHNVMEYKSPEDRLDIDTFYKVGAYASLYKAYGRTVDAVKADDVTVSILRETKPEALFGYFKSHGFTVTNPFRGIYYVQSGVLFPTQIVVTRELDKAGHSWLRFLSNRLEKQDVVEMLENIGRLSEKRDQELADSVLKVSAEANRQVVNELIGGNTMYEALLEFMEPQKKLWKKEGLDEGIQGAVDTLRDFGHEEEEIKTAIMKRYDLSEEEAENYLGVRGSGQKVTV
ncbi:MAG: hypothetical protein NC541_09795 [bacterium]|nr:hypothetical protein [bacterium]